ncbi:MAG: anti-phage ZorAB system protein ZorA [Nitrospirota bacterium]|nr:anti-phage ZorAB system protein ZorA [Nitrospirota bacterium]
MGTLEEELIIQPLVTFLEQVHPAFSNLTGVPFYVFLLVLALSGVFLVGYLVQGIRVGCQLWLAVRGIRKLTAAKKPVDPKEIAKLLKKEPFRHLWDEYSDTLHSLQGASSGTATLVEVRATMPAEVFFTRDVLVDSRMFDDFVRHLPGVLTGLGIIGTFAGLLDGLSQFNPSTTSTAVAGLKPLLDGVAHAFIASAAAISCAMIVLFIEKLVLAFFYGMVEQLNQVIDALYRTGAGEEYLARLTQSAEKSEAHAAQLKEALVEDLKTMMTNLVDRQIEAQQQSTQALGNQLGNAILEGLQKPMQDIGEAVKRASGEQGSAVHGMLESVLTAFMARLEDTFGGQMRGINESMERSMDAMANVQASLQRLLENIGKSTESATSQMSQTLEDAMKQAATNQQVMTDQMREFVQEFRKLVTDEQSKSKQVMDEAMSNVLTQLSTAMEHLKHERNISAQEESDRQEQTKIRTTELVGGLSGQVEALVRSIAEQVEKTQRNIDTIGAVSIRAIDGMNQGALTMGSAAQRFETAGSAVSTVFERSKTVADQLQSAALAVKQGFDQYENTRKTVDSHVNTLTALIENAKREAGLTKEMLGDMERIVEQLRAAEAQSLQYLEQVNGALVKAFTDFGTQMRNQVASTIAQTDTHLGNGVLNLKAVVQEFGDAISRIPRN